jgi:hypothetical protein
MTPRRTLHRPLQRHAIKIAALAFGRRWSHGHNWLPFLKFEREAGETSARIVFKGRTVGRLSSADLLCDRLTGNAVHIIGSGPSILQTDLSKIGPGSALLLNGAVELIGTHIEDPLAVVVEDERFIWRHFDSLKVKIPAEITCLFSVAVIRAICEIETEWLSGRQIVLIDDIRKPYAAPKPELGELKERPYVTMDRDGNSGISLEPDRGVFQGGSVVISALQFAIHCRPASIGLIGIDISNAAEPRFYEQNGNAAPSGLKRAEGRILSHLVLGKAVAAQNNIELLNHSATSLLNRHGFAYDNRFEKTKGR